VEIYDISFGLPSSKRGKSGLSLSQGREERKRRKKGREERRIKWREAELVSPRS
jgi:hypothetical protein